MQVIHELHINFNSITKPQDMIVTEISGEGWCKEFNKTRSKSLKV
jgi:hypothetical protein